MNETINSQNYNVNVFWDGKGYHYEIIYVPLDTVVLHKHVSRKYNQAMDAGVLALSRYIAKKMKANHD